MLEWTSLAGPFPVLHAAGSTKPASGLHVIRRMEFMDTILSRCSRTAATLAAVLLVAAGCNRGSAAGSVDTAASAQNASADTANATVMLRGTVASANSGQIVLTTDTNTVTVKVTQPLQVYDRAPSDLSHVKDSSFIGVTTVKQADGSERATEIHIFPNELRGLGEGSRMMSPSTGGGSGNRMTNGSVSSSRMTNGSVSSSRMSNGTVANATGSTLVVQYPGGSQNVTVPAGTPVTEIKAVSKPLAAGDRVVIVAKKQSDGSLVSTKALIASK